MSAPPQRQEPEVGTIRTIERRPRGRNSPLEATALGLPRRRRPRRGPRPRRSGPARRCASAIRTETVTGIDEVGLLRVLPEGDPRSYGDVAGGRCTVQPHAPGAAVGVGGRQRVRHLLRRQGVHRAAGRGSGPVEEPWGVRRRDGDRAGEAQAGRGLWRPFGRPGGDGPGGKAPPARACRAVRARRRRAVQRRGRGSSGAPGGDQVGLGGCCGVDGTEHAARARAPRR